MGNFLGLCAFGGSNKAVMQVMKMNEGGKILEFRAPIRVRDLLVKYPNSYVGMFKEATQALPLDYKLKFGRIYYLIPCFSTTSETLLAHRGGARTDEVRRIKLVITRQQLEQILSNQATLEDLIMAVKKRPCKRVSPVKACNLQKLEAIPEDGEGVY